MLITSRRSTAAWFLSSSEPRTRGIALNKGRQFITNYRFKPLILVKCQDFWGKRVEYYYNIGGCPTITSVVVLSLPQRHRYGVVKDKSPYQTQDQLNPTVYYICTVLNIKENVGITNVVECITDMPRLCCEELLWLYAHVFCMTCSLPLTLKHTNIWIYVLALTTAPYL